MSQNPNITWDVIYKFPDSSIDWYYIGLNITWDIIKDNFDKPWDLMSLSENPNMTWDIIKDNPDMPWDIKTINARFIVSDFDSSLIIIILYNVVSIKKHFQKSNWNPRCKQCLKRIWIVT